MTEYLTKDWQTLVEEFKDSLRNSDTFKDYNFEGSNINILLELIGFLGEMETFYTNMLAKNMFIDSASTYENTHRIAQLTGYHPKGYQAARGDLTLEITQNTSDEYFSYNDELVVKRGNYFTAEFNQEEITFVTPRNTNSTVDLSFTEDGDTDDITYWRMKVPIKQGEIVENRYTGNDIFNNKIILPFQTFDSNTTFPPIWVYVNDELWERVDNFYDDYSGTENSTKVYRFYFDKYKRYAIEFSSNRTELKSTDEIRVENIVTEHTEGNVASNLVQESDQENLVYNITKEIWIPINNISINNNRPIAGGREFESIEEIKDKAKNFFSTQYRTVTQGDFKGFLESRDDIEKSNVWGEQEIAYGGDTREYNKVYLSVIPKDWNLSTIDTNTELWNIPNGKTTNVLVPNRFMPGFKDDIRKYLEPWKYLNTFEVFVLPELAYFAFSLGVEIQRNYDFSEVANDIRSKIAYYFDPSRRKFNDVINFRDIEKFLLDTSITSEDDNFSNISGVTSITFRDIYTHKEVYEPNKNNDFPQYKVNISESSTNKLRTIILGHNQFPILAKNACTISIEG